MLKATKRMAGLLALTILTACGPAGEDAGPSGSPGPDDLRALIAKVVEAQGGEEALAGVTSVFERKTDRLFSLDERDRRVVVLVNSAGDIRYAEGFDGSDAWQIVQDQPKQALPEEGRAAIWRLTQLPSVLVPLSRMEELGHSVELAGRASIEGTEYYDLALKLSDGFERHCFINSTTYRMERARDTPQASAGEAQPIETFWSDFRSVDGVWIPFESGQRNYETGEQLSKHTLQEVTLNVVVPDDVFRLDGSLDPLLAIIMDQIGAPE